MLDRLMFSDSFAAKCLRSAIFGSPGIAIMLMMGDWA